jgi:hypothetical protein
MDEQNHQLEADTIRRVGEFRVLATCEWKVTEALMCPETGEDAHHKGREFRKGACGGGFILGNGVDFGGTPPPPGPLESAI